jgi:hypothetical protein
MENPRKNPMTMTDVGYGEHAIGMGSRKLGQALAKCLSEINLLLSMPPSNHSQNVMRILKKNLQQVMGMAEPDEDD